MEDIKGSRLAKYIKTFKEINIAFLPYESNVFMLDNQKSFRDVYAQDGQNRQDVLERYGEQLATLCSLLGEYPAIRWSFWITKKIIMKYFLFLNMN